MRTARSSSRLLGDLPHYTGVGLKSPRPLNLPLSQTPQSSPRPGPGDPPCEQNSWHTLLKILPCPKFVGGGNKQGPKVLYTTRTALTWQLIFPFWREFKFVKGKSDFILLSFYYLWAVIGPGSFFLPKDSLALDSLDKFDLSSKRKFYSVVSLSHHWDQISQNLSQKAWNLLFQPNINTRSFQISYAIPWDFINIFRHLRSNSSVNYSNIRL